MISRKLAGAGAVSVGAVTAVAALLLGSVSGTAADESSSSAYGLAVQGLVDVPPTPQVVAPPDGSAALVELPSPLGVGVLKVQAAGTTSSATAVDLNIADLIVAQVIKATCDNGTGEVSILGGEIAGTPLPEDPAVGQDLDLSPVATVKFNRQTENEDGTLTVNAVGISVLPGGQAPDLPVTPDMLDQLSALAPDLAVPSMDQLPAAPPLPGQPATPTLDDLLTQLAELNPDLDIPTGEGESLLDIVISSATCGKAKVTEAPKPKPVETKLPVTH